MASTTFVDYSTPAVNAAWLNDANDATYHEYNADLVAAELAAGVTPANPLYPAEDIRRYTSFQDAIDVGNVVFPPGDYAYSDDFDIPANRKIWVQKGATVTNTGGRFTAYDVDNVEWQIDGWVKSVSMDAAPALTGWPSVAAGTEVGSCRGFIEFGGPDASLVGYSPRKGFWVHGTGKVSGDWTGTPNVSDLPTAVNRRGIIAMCSSNVRVEGVEVFGFLGEAVYAQAWGANENVVFQDLFIHDTQFNGANFNAGATGKGWCIQRNTIRNCYQGIETSVGTIVENDISDTEGIGTYTGNGSGVGPVIIRKNTVSNAGLHSIAASFASGTPVSKVYIEDNVSIDPAQYAVYVAYIRQFSIARNTCIGSAQSAGAYDIGLVNSQNGVVHANTFLSPGPSAQAGRIYVDPATCFDVSASAVSNVYVQSTGSNPISSGNQVQTIASASALPIPMLGDTFIVSGTTNISSITTADGSNNHAGRKITLLFAGILTVTDGSNLTLAGNFVTTSNDTLTLLCIDGTNWYEVARSVN